jgi:hypothetical protein
MSQSFHEQFCGAFSGCKSLSKRAQDHAKRTTVNTGAVGEHKGKKAKIEIHISLQRVNRFMNGFVERFHGVNWYPNEPNIMQNEPW